MKRKSIKGFLTKVLATTTLASMLCTGSFFVQNSYAAGTTTQTEQK